MVVYSTTSLTSKRSMAKCSFPRTNSTTWMDSDSYSAWRAAAFFAVATGPLALALMGNTPALFHLEPAVRFHCAEAQHRSPSGSCGDLIDGCSRLFRCSSCIAGLFGGLLDEMGDFVDAGRNLLGGCCLLLGCGSNFGGAVGHGLGCFLDCLEGLECLLCLRYALASQGSGILPWRPLLSWWQD